MHQSAALYLVHSALKGSRSARAILPDSAASGAVRPIVVQHHAR